MKRFLIALFAVAVVAAWAVPSQAIDFGGELWVKGEWRDNVNFEDNAVWTGTGTVAYDDTDQAYIGQRTRLWGVAHPTDDTTVKVTIQDTTFWGQNGARRPNGGPYLTDESNTGCWGVNNVGVATGDQDPDDAEDAFGNDNENDNVAAKRGDYALGSGASCNNISIHEAWLQVDDFFGVDGLAFKIGRQELVYGDQRLIGSFGWNEHGRSFDAIKFMYRTEQFDVDVFTSKIADGSAGFTPGNAANDSVDRDQDFYGIYATLKLIENNTIDLYALLLRDGSRVAMIGNNELNPGNLSPVGSIDASQKLWTLGVRVAGNADLNDTMALDYTFELPYQTGSINTVSSAKDLDISAYALAVKAGITLKDMYNLRLGLEYDYASGDSKPGDSKIETFTNLFPTNHGHYGHMDLQGWRNTDSWGITAKAKPTDKLTVYAAYWLFQLAEQEDAWYGAGTWNNRQAGVGTANTGNAEKDLGAEVDLSASYKYNSAVTFQGGFSHYFTNDIIQQTLRGNDTDQNWAWLKVAAKF